MANQPQFDDFQEIDTSSAKQYGIFGNGASAVPSFFSSGNQGQYPQQTQNMNSFDTSAVDADPAGDFLGDDLDELVQAAAGLSFSLRLTTRRRNPRQIPKSAAASIQFAAATSIQFAATTSIQFAA